MKDVLAEHNQTSLTEEDLRGGNPLKVAAAVILKPDGRFLLAQRPAGKPYAGYWEFPGGKVKAHETSEQALRRELQEELGISAEQIHPWLTQVYRYPHATVRLCFHRVMRWSGEPHSRENQQLSWQSAERVDVAPLLPANGPVLRALSLPPVYAISNVAELGRENFMQRLEQALQNGLRLIQVREKYMPRGELEDFSAAVITTAHRYQAKVLVNSDIRLVHKLGADGVHLTSQQFMVLKRRPQIEWCGASCHDREQLQRAAALGVDFAVLAPVLPTLSHPGAPGMGWGAFAQLVEGYSLPVYALGGMREQHLSTAWAHGAHGIAMMRGAWLARNL
ncbi:MAG: Nudix family hydrolase [Burkholderiales bacterium]